MRTTAVAGHIVGVLGAGVGLAAACGASLIGWPASQAGALLVGAATTWHVTRRLGGVTGDVFGALVELGTATTLIGLALAS
jgi:adenosylcobinamide-GDP ribazoletransferase